MRTHPAVIVLTTLLMTITASAQTAPLTLNCSTDSVRVIFGDFNQRIPLQPNLHPDTSRLAMHFDLRLVSETDSLFIARTTSPVEVQFLLSSGVHTEIFLFYDPPDTSRVTLLKNYPKYEPDSISAKLRLSYRRPHDSLLTRLRALYPLDSIAGSGTTAERAINLLRWVHDTIRHDGNQENPTGNTLERFAKCLNGGASMNCGGLAGALADVYAAVGYQSRTVVGLPYDTADFECHQWTELWSEEDQKWLFMDPTNYAYFTNPLGKLMQITEVRQELALGDPARRAEFLQINNDLNWNGQPLERAQYLNYMAKNLFRFRTWAFTSLDSTRSWTIELMPVGYTSLPMGMALADGDTWFRTHDVSLFWMPPSKGAKK